MHKVHRHPFKQRAKHKPRHWAARRARRAALTLAALSLGAMAAAGGQTLPLRPTGTAPHSGGESREARAERWKESFDAFAAADRVQAPRPGGVLFVGSSSIRLWEGLEQDFQMLPVVIKRGFGGSRLSDVAEHVSRLVLPYRPRLVVVYAGDNDLAEGASPEDVLASFTRFVDAVRAELPKTSIAYLSIKPSPLRAQLLDKARAANALIEGYAAGTPGIDYIDVYSKMLGPDGRPRVDLFSADRLHLNRAGYALWKQEISSRLAIAGALPGATPGAALATAGAPRASP